MAKDELYELAYISVAIEIPAEDELAKLLIKARGHNEQLHVTGMLLYSSGTFLQVLEGPESTVRGLYEEIHADPRHTRLLVIHEGPLESRHFPDWTMGFQQLDDAEASRLDGFSDLLDPASPLRDRLAAAPAKAYRLLLEFSACSGIVPEL